MHATEPQIAALSENAVVIATFWMSYQKLVAAPATVVGNVFNLDRAAYQVLSLIAPFVRGSDRLLIDQLGRDYIR